MNTIEEILKKKNETIYETYRRTICKECENRKNDKDLCKITRTNDNKAVCFNYEKCMKNKCKTCKDSEKCFKEEGQK